MVEYYGNDKVTKLLEWLFIGGVDNNAARTIPYVDIWINFSHESKKENKILSNATNKLVYHPLRFDDGNLRQGQTNWLKAFEIINKNKGKKILISCTEGVSRSAVMCLWLLCEEFGNFNKAIEHLKTNRKIFIDRGFNDFVNYLKQIYN